VGCPREGVCMHALYQGLAIGIVNKAGGVPERGCVYACSIPGACNWKSEQGRWGAREIGACERERER